MSAANRRTNVPVELQTFVVPDVRPTGRELGVGSYGSVEEAHIQGAICVIKKLHEALLPAPTEAHGADRMIDTFAAECRLMSTLRHPHIVQFLGVCFLTGSRLPALVMEKLLTDLHNFLESNNDIPLTMKRSILVDVAKGLIYLHTRNPPVIHRDLTARNVLLNSAMVAKIADLGNSRIINIRPGQLMTMTKTPGNVCYMPPEALEDTSRYNTAIDIFSFGNLTLFTLTQTLPKVKNATYLHPTTRRVIGRSEIERRIESMDAISQVLGRQHPLVQLAKSCLQDDPQNRPSIATVLQRLESCRLVHYRSWEANKLEMATDIMGKEREIEILQQQTQALKVENESQRQQIENDQMQIRSLQDEKRMQQELIDLQQRQIEGDRTRIEAFEKENRTHSIPKQHHRTTRQEVERQHNVMLVPGLETQLRDLTMQAKQQKKLPFPTSFEWRTCRNLPIIVFGATTVVINGKVYLAYDEHILEYTPENDEWVEVPKSPIKWFGLAVLNNQLVLVGGIELSTKKRSNKLTVFNTTSRQWVHPYPPMRTPRSRPSAIVYQHYLIVAGGEEDGNKSISTVEILDSVQVHWYTAEQLPMKCDSMLPVVISNTGYLLGGFLDDEQTKTFLTVSLPALIYKATSQSKEVDTPTSWKTLPDSPLHLSAPFTSQNRLLTAGGDDDSGKASSHIYCYDPVTNQWEKVGDLPEPRYQCSCVVLSTTELLVVGGWQYSTSVCKATIRWKSDN